MIKALFNRFKKRQGGSQISTAWPFGNITPGLWWHRGISHHPKVYKCL